MDTLISDTASSASLADDFLPACVGGWIWHPNRTGDYDADCQHGRALADHIIKRMVDEGNPLLLSIIARSMVEERRWEAVEVGFFSRLAGALQVALK